MSQPARAVWIEICIYVRQHGKLASQPARAVWIEITIFHPGLTNPGRHSLRGLCGLKYYKHLVTGICEGVTACEGCVD